MTMDNTTPVDETTLFLGYSWSDPIEAGIRDRIRGFIEELTRKSWPSHWDGGVTNARARPTLCRRVRRLRRRRLPVTGTAIASDGSPAPSAPSR